MKLLVMIPCFNEEKTIKDIVRDIPRTIDEIEKVDVVVIDDGSKDNSAEYARESGAIVISHQYNKGVGAAFNTGMEYAIKNEYDILVNIDADRQFNPDDIPKLIYPIIKNEADFVSASRFVDKSLTPQGMSKVKLWGNKGMSFLVSKLTQKKFYDVSCGFRAYSRECMLRINLQGKFTYTQESFLDLAFKEMRIKEVPISVKYFKERKSKVAGSILNYALQTSYIIFRAYRDYYPLRFFWTIASIAGIIGLGMLGFLMGWYIYAGKFSPHIWSGFVGGSFLGISLIFFIIGIVADMLDRVRINQERILYLLKKNDKE